MHRANTGRREMKTILETDRPILREFVLDDMDDFFKMVSDPDVTLGEDPR